MLSGCSRVEINRSQITDRVLQEAKRRNRNPAQVIDVLYVAIKQLELSGDAKTTWNENLATLEQNSTWARGDGNVSVGDEANEAISILLEKEGDEKVLDELLALAQNSADSSAPASSPSARQATDPKPKVETSEPELEKVLEEASKTLEACLAELDSLVGLAEVKNQIKLLIATHQVNEERIKVGLKTVTPGNNLVFSGEPGTGKTTVARIVSEIYRSIGLLEKGHLIEAGKADLIGEYVGQTAPKVKEIVKKALNGTLFIDEAYSLNEGRLGGYGEEAVATLLQEMENNRKKLAVIVAGYSEEMDLFIKSNPGLRSRFNTVIDFPSYSAEDLTEIFRRMADSHDIKLGKGVEEKLIQHFKSVDTSGAAGNGRYVRKLFERMNNNLSQRAVADGVIELKEITAFVPEDVPDNLDSQPKNKQRIGF